MGQCQHGFTPAPECDTCEGSGDCLLLAIRRGEIDGRIGLTDYRGGKPVLDPVDWRNPPIDLWADI